MLHYFEYTFSLFLLQADSILTVLFISSITFIPSSRQRNLFSLRNTWCILWHWSIKYMFISSFFSLPFPRADEIHFHEHGAMFCGCYFNFLHCIACIVLVFKMKYSLSLSSPALNIYKIFPLGLQNLLLHPSPAHFEVCLEL